MPGHQMPWSGLRRSQTTASFSCPYGGQTHDRNQVKLLLLLLAVPVLGVAANLLVVPLMLALAAALIGYGLFSIVHRLRTGRWPKGRPVQPQPEGLNERERLAFHAVMGNQTAQEMCDTLNDFERTGTWR